MAGGFTFRAQRSTGSTISAIKIHGLPSTSSQPEEGLPAPESAITPPQSSTHQRMCFNDSQPYPPSGGESIRLLLSPQWGRGPCIDVRVSFWEDLMPLTSP
ncbi:unnamed protein product [Gadus morhua 'NCC']